MILDESELHEGMSRTEHVIQDQSAFFHHTYIVGGQCGNLADSLRRLTSCRNASTL